MEQPKTLQEAIRYFSDEQTCIDAVAAIRWPEGKPVCPACMHTEHYYLKTQKRWKCKECYKQFSVKLNTIFEDSPIGLDKWLVAMWMLANCKNGVSSYEIHRAIGITQKSAWFMMHRIRLAMKSHDFRKIGGAGICEADETFIGGKVRNMHESRRLKIEQMKGAGLKNETKAIIAGVIDRERKEIRAEVISNRDRTTLDALIQKHVKFGSTVFTDDYTGYMGLRTRFIHEKLNKQVEGYVRGKVHTQGIENFWSLLKRGIGGTYVCVEPEHLSRYLDEQMYRYNNRMDKKDGDRFTKLLTQVTGKRLTFAEVTGKVGETRF